MYMSIAVIVMYLKGSNLHTIIQYYNYYPSVQVSSAKFGCLLIKLLPLAMDGW